MVFRLVKTYGKPYQFDSFLKIVNNNFVNIHVSYTYYLGQTF